jgi:hypothetical protein
MWSSSIHATTVRANAVNLAQATDPGGRKSTTLLTAISTGFWKTDTRQLVEGRPIGKYIAQYCCGKFWDVRQSLTEAVVPENKIPGVCNELDKGLPKGI